MGLKGEKKSVVEKLARETMHRKVVGREEQRGASESQAPREYTREEPGGGGGCRLVLGRNTLYFFFVSYKLTSIYLRGNYWSELCYTFLFLFLIIFEKLERKLLELINLLYFYFL